MDAVTSVATQKTNNLFMFYRIIAIIGIIVFFFYLNCFAFSIKQSEFAGQFYPDQKEELSRMIDNFLTGAQPRDISGDIFMLISPHAGYGYSGQTAAYGYKLIQGKPYQTVIILGTSHHKAFDGAAIYNQGAFVTALGSVNIDDELAKKMAGKDPEFFADASFFNNEHSVEVELPFLQKVLGNFKIVPLVVGDCSLDTCKKIARLIREAIGERKDVLIVVSTDLYHGYDFEEADQIDTITLGFIKDLDYEKLYYALRDGKAQACGGSGTVIGLAIAKDLGYKQTEVLNHTNSAIVTGKALKGDWTVGYSSCAVFNLTPRAYSTRPLMELGRYPPGGGELRGYARVGQGENMLNIQQRKELLNIARGAIEKYLQMAQKLQVNENDPVLNQKTGVFVTLTEHGRLRGCIGDLVGTEPLYLTVRNMAIEAAVDDPRFPALSLPELKNVRLEISVLSPLERIDSAAKIELGKHGVLVRKGNQSGVFLPQVATETGWSKEEFLSQLCAQKAGLPADAWKDKSCELYTFSAEVFSEKELE